LALWAKSSRKGDVSGWGGLILKFGTKPQTPQKKKKKINSKNLNLKP